VTLRSVLTAVCLAVGLPALAAGQALPPTRVTIPRAAAQPTLADYLPGGSAPGLRVDDFRQREPKDLEPVTQPTVAYLSYDARHVYVAFVCTQPRADIRARLQKREDLGSDDGVGVYLDTFHDKQRGYFFLSSPIGIQADGIISETSGDDYSFDTQWDSEGRLVGDGYVVLMTIPFKALRFPARPAGAQEWGVALVREIESNSETSYWPGNTQRVNGFIAQFATADGIEGVSPGRNIQLNPYGTFTGARFLEPDGSTYERENEGRAGLDVKLVPRDAVTLDFTLNPDFSQVESDEPQVTVNQRFEVFFPEKRPFFLENSDFFSSVLTLFFSRRIRDPQVGARMTGKFGKWAAGALVMDDRAPGRLVEPTSPASGDRAVNVVGSLRRDFANQSNLGFFATSRTFGESSNQVGSVNAHIRLNANWFLDAQAVGSHDTSLEGETANGSATFLGLVRNGRGLNYYLSWSSVSPDFRVPLGFVPRTDMHNAYSFLSYRWYPKTGPVTEWGPNSYVDATWTYGGDLQDSTVRFPVSFDFKKQTDAFYRHAIISETVGGVRLDQREDLFQVETSALPWLDVEMFAAFGTRPNYFPGNGLTPFLGDYQDWNLSATVKPVTRLSISETLLWSKLDGRDGTPAAGAPIFDNLLLRSRANYQFTREWSLRAIVDYDTLDPNPAVVGLERSRRVGADVLLTWLAHPGTAVYVGYTDGYADVRINPTRPGLTEDGALRSTGRQVFVKASWLFRF
jgi:hypothetical protein